MEKQLIRRLKGLPAFENIKIGHYQSSKIESERVLSTTRQSISLILLMNQMVTFGMSKWINQPIVESIRTRIMKSPLPIKKIILVGNINIIKCTQVEITRGEFTHILTELTIETHFIFE